MTENSYFEKIENIANKLIVTDVDIEMLNKQTGLSLDYINQWHEKFKIHCPSGMMNKKEFIEHWTQLTGHPIEPDLLKRIFRAFGKDNDKNISCGEFLVGLCIVYGSDLFEKLHYIFKVYDKNKDYQLKEMKNSGNDGKISISEFITGCLNDSSLCSLLNPF
ncbi:hypothetical protein GJ496_007927 [Pomphorhynchus laevis]|nr:hypothetical protein GJ496_007927 [Pomphorhynchus laevis]